MELAELLVTLKADSKKENPLTKLLLEIERLDKDRSVNVSTIIKKLNRLDEILKELEGKVPVPQALRVWAGAYRASIEEEGIRARDRFGIDLESALKPLGLQLTGAYPTLRASLFVIELDKEANQASLWYGYQQERISRVPLLADKVKERIEATLKELGTSIPTEAFITKLREACVRAANGRTGEDVPIVKVLVEMAILLQKPIFFEDPRRENYTGYSRADFSYDLYRLRDKLSEHGLRLRIAARTYNERKEYIWIPDNPGGHGTRYSHLQFKESSHE